LKRKIVKEKGTRAAHFGEVNRSGAAHVLKRCSEVEPQRRRQTLSNWWFLRHKKPQDADKRKMGVHDLKLPQT